MEITVDLNTTQQEAVEHITGPLLVIAGAGSGKTRIVTNRIAYLIEHGVPPSSIVAVTFTNKAAEEMRSRVMALCNHDVLISTFHSLGVRILREAIHNIGYNNDFVIYDEEDSIKLINVCLKSAGINSKEISPKNIKHLISNAKNSLLSPSAINNEHSARESELERAFPAVYSHYKAKLKECQALDFDDLLYLTVCLFKEHPSVLETFQQRWHYLLIDEYQDTNYAQYMMAKLLVDKSQNIFVVGDPDQSIYSWRGANIENILNFERDYPGAKVVRLEQNYRSQKNILDAANSLITHNTSRYKKNLWSDLGEGEKILIHRCKDERQEVQFVIEQIEWLHSQGMQLAESVIFYRTNAQSRLFEDLLLTKGMPYTIVGGISFYQRREIKDILAFLKIVHSDADYISFARTINLPKRGIGHVTIDKLKRASEERNLPIYKFCLDLLRGDIPETEFKLAPRTKKALEDYTQIIQSLRKASKEETLKTLITKTINDTGYITHIRQEKETFDDRKNNIEELISKAHEFDSSQVEASLEVFLQELTLKTTLEDAYLIEDRLKLMTIHNGKGLEFEATFLVGMEEQLFPHINSKHNEEAIEEERRLCYVGMTRAKQLLYMTCAHTRHLWGTQHYMRPSRFLKEIPQKYIQEV
ncbi:UvrD-helicase domain-containing protein [Simkania negevensis]|uniref:DNA 3'-5' helicase n=1 Tax=Simkania negevensis TaxID=83561 RepID=A0ABS3APH7_9BACT|nr:UvrD-helicase domain-containing protein [Simkania negevensis]